MYVGSGKFGGGGTSGALIFLKYFGVDIPSNLVPQYNINTKTIFFHCDPLLFCPSQAL